MGTVELGVLLLSMFTASMALHFCLSAAAPLRYLPPNTAAPAESAPKIWPQSAKVSAGKLPSPGITTQTWKCFWGALFFFRTRGTTRENLQEKFLLSHGADFHMQ